MNDINPISSRASSLPAQVERASSERNARREVAQSEADAGDRVELSVAATSYDPEAEAVGAMEQRISDIRAQIADGTYLTPEKLDAAIERLCEDLVGA